METTIAGITAVESKDINTAKGPSTLFLVKDNLGVEYSTFDRELAVQAAALKGHNAEIGFEISTSTKPNKQGVNTTYTNRYLKSLSAASEHSFDSTPAPTPPVASQGLTAPSGGIQFPNYTPDPRIVTQQDKDASIARAVALKAAVEAIVGGVAENNDIIGLAEYYRGWLQGEVAPEPVFAGATAADDIPF